MLPFKALKSLFVVLGLIHITNGLHFYVNTDETKCFYEEMSKDTLLVSKIDAYEREDHGNEYIKNNNLKIHVTVDETFDNDHRVASQAVKEEFIFTSLDSGEHRICITPSYSDGNVGKTHRIFFDIVTGLASDYVDSKSTRKVDELTAHIQDLTKKLSGIHYEQESMREREAVFRDQSESTNFRVVKWSIIQFIVLVGTCVYQLHHLKSFFVKQKIV